MVSINDSRVCGFAHEEHALSCMGSPMGLAYVVGSCISRGRGENPGCAHQENMYPGDTSSFYERTRDRIKTLGRDDLLSRIEELFKGLQHMDDIRSMAETSIVPQVFLGQIYPHEGANKLYLRAESILASAGIIGEEKQSRDLTVEERDEIKQLSKQVQVIILRESDKLVAEIDQLEISKIQLELA